MGDDQDRTVPSGPRAPADGVTRVDDLLKELDRVDLDRGGLDGRDIDRGDLDGVDEPRSPAPGRLSTPDSARGLDELMDWMAEEQPTPLDRPGPSEVQTAYSEHFRVVVMGASGVGKTALVRAMSDHGTTGVFVRTGGDRAGRGTALAGPVPTTNEYVGRTGSTLLDDGLRWRLFDLNSKENFWGAWDRIARDAHGAVVLVDPARWQDSFPWLDYVEQRGLPFVVALNTFAGAHDRPADEIRAALDLHPDCPVVTCDARDRDSATGVLRELSARVRPKPLFTELAIGERHSAD